MITTDILNTDRPRSWLRIFGTGAAHMLRIRYEYASHMQVPLLLRGDIVTDFIERLIIIIKNTSFFYDQT